MLNIDISMPLSHLDKNQTQRPAVLLSSAQKNKCCSRYHRLIHVKPESLVLFQVSNFDVPMISYDEN